MQRLRAHAVQAGGMLSAARPQRTKAQHKRKGAQAVDDNSVNTKAENTNNAGEMSEFEKLMQKIADMPAAEQEKIAFFVNGYIAAHKTTEAATA